MHNIEGILVNGGDVKIEYLTQKDLKFVSFIFKV